MTAAPGRDSEGACSRTAPKSKLRTCLWFDGTAEAAARFCVALIPGSGVEGTTGATAQRAPLMVAFHLGCTPCQALNGRDAFSPSPAVSIRAITEDQQETDRLWAALIAHGGSENRCAWCTDRFGMSWQVVPRQLLETVGGPDPAGAARATQAMLEMGKIDIAALETACRG